MSPENVHIGDYCTFTETPQKVELDAWAVCAQNSPVNRRKRLIAINIIEQAEYWGQYWGSRFNLPADIFATYKRFTDYRPQPLTIDVDGITFGQFLDAKMILEGGSELSLYRQSVYLLVIFSPGYEAKFCNEQSAEFKSAHTFRLSDALAMVEWFNAFNTKVYKDYAIFADSGEPPEHHIQQHMKRWGWIHFLKQMVTCGAFHRCNGKNGIDNVREAPLSDVLTWAGEEKEYNLASSRDYKSKNR